MSRSLRVGIVVAAVAVVLSVVAFACTRNYYDNHRYHNNHYHTTQPRVTEPQLPPNNGNYPYQQNGVNVPMNARPARSPSPEILRGDLPQREAKIAQPNHTLPTTKIEHSYGVPQDGKPHQISIDNQTFFDNHPEYYAVAYDNVSTNKVLYLTFDCGYENGNTAKILDVLRDKDVPAAFFCTTDHFKQAPDLITRMIEEGHIVGNHSNTHASFSGLTRTQMTEEVIAADNYLREHFGYSSPFFRYPCGNYSESALDAVASLGFSNIFWSSSYADWDTNAQKGGQYALDTMMARLHPGAIILLHSVSADNAAAMADFIDGARAQGYTFQELTNLPMFHA